MTYEIYLLLVRFYNRYNILFDSLGFTCNDSHQQLCPAMGMSSHMWHSGTTDVLLRSAQLRKLQRINVQSTIGNLGHEPGQLVPIKIIIVMHIRWNETLTHDRALLVWSHDFQHCSSRQIRIRLKKKKKQFSDLIAPTETPTLITITVDLLAYGLNGFHTKLWLYARSIKNQFSDLV